MDTDVTIIIKTVTEKVTYQEMSEREKQIYKHAYNEGFLKGEKMRGWSLMAAVLFIGSIVNLIVAQS